jgi:hypothetical protein
MKRESTLKAKLMSFKETVRTKIVINLFGDTIVVQHT